MLGCVNNAPMLQWLDTGMLGFDRETEEGEASRQADDVNQAKTITANDNELAYAA